MTSDEYPDYMNRVLAATDGANVHAVNGLLGLVINNAACVERRELREDFEGAAPARAALEEAMRKIRVLTGV